jgi:3-dehydroquinate synthase
MAVDLGRVVAGDTRRPQVGVAVISDARVASLYGRRVLASLGRSGVKAALVSFPHGERFKTRETKSAIEDRLVSIGFGSDGIIVALGGGVTGDLAGFVAATWHRGVPFVQAPTSLIAMLDAAIGGKVAVDLPLAKNLIGAWHHPLAVYADTDVLETLPRREFFAGLAEAVKCGAIADAALFRLLERSTGPLRRRDRAIVSSVIRCAAGVKARIVSLDERDHGARKLLNYGHTIGHAIEAVSGYRGILHGEAISAGMMAAAEIGRRIGVTPATVGERQASLFERYGLPLRQPGLDADAVIAATLHDKKVSAKRVRWVLLEDFGRPVVRDDVPDTVVREALASILG